MASPQVEIVEGPVVIDGKTYKYGVSIDGVMRPPAPIWFMRGCIVFFVLILVVGFIAIFKYGRWP